MAFQCGVCQRAPSGFGWIDPPLIDSGLYGNPQQGGALIEREHSRRRFCSLVCQGLYHDMYHSGITMNQDQIETKARQQALQSLADYVVTVGMAKPMADYTRSEIDGLIESVLSGYKTALQEIYKTEIPF